MIYYTNRKDKSNIDVGEDDTDVCSDADEEVKFVNVP